MRGWPSFSSFADGLLERYCVRLLADLVAQFIAAGLVLGASAVLSRIALIAGGRAMLQLQSVYVAAIVLAMKYRTMEPEPAPRAKSSGGEINWQSRHSGA